MTKNKKDVLIDRDVMERIKRLPTTGDLINKRNMELNQQLDACTFIAGLELIIIVALFLVFIFIR
jgi:hypothetical protein